MILEQLLDYKHLDTFGFITYDKALLRLAELKIRTP